VSAVLAVGDRPELDGDVRVPDLTRVRWTDDGLVAD
jgi:hypothetical protein